MLQPNNYKGVSVPVETERIAVLEVEVKHLRKTVEETNAKLDSLLELKSKGVGAFWLASALLGTGIVSALTTFISWMRG